MKEMKNPVFDEKKNKSGYTSGRMLRGGSWFDDAQDVRVSGRGYSFPTGANDNFGFRIVRNKK